MRIVYLCILFLCEINAFSQRQINGYVKDFENCEPIKYALVINSDRSRGTYTDEKGYFKIKIKDIDTLKVKHIAYNEKRLIISQNEESVLILMKKNIIELEEVTILVKNKKKKIKSVSSLLNCLGYESVYALEILPKGEKKLLGASIFIGKEGNPEAPFRLMILENLSNNYEIFNDHVYEIKAQRRKSWLDIFFKVSELIEDTIYIAIERIYKPDYNYDGDCNGISLGLSKIVDPNQRIFEKFPKNWILVDFHNFSKGYNLMLEPIWEE